MQLKTNGLKAEVTTVADARWHWRAVLRQRFSEVWLDAGAEGPSLAMLVNGGRAWLMYLRHNDGDTGFSSRDPHYSGPAGAVMEFFLSNGQRDEYPVAWTLPLVEALAACEHFITTNGGQSSDIVWHDDAIHDESW